MEAIKHYLDMMSEAGVVKYIISNPFLKSEPVRKINVEKTLQGYKISKYTEKQAFHENVKEAELTDRLCNLITGHYRQVNGMSASRECILLISKKVSAIIR